MIRSRVWPITLVGCVAVSAALQAQQTPVVLGDTVRVSNAVPLVTAGANAGVLVSLTSDTLVLRPLKNLETSTWLLRDGTRLSVKRGEKSFGVVKGMLIGTLFALAATLIYESGDDPAARGCELVGYGDSGNPIYQNCDSERREAGEVIIPLSASWAASPAIFSSGTAGSMSRANSRKPGTRAKS